MKLSTLRISCAYLSSALSLVAIAGLLTTGAPQASAQEFSHAAGKTPEPIKGTHVLHPSSTPPELRVRRSVVAHTVPVQTNLPPVNTGTGVLFTCDPNVAVATCKSLNSTVAATPHCTIPSGPS